MRALITGITGFAAPSGITDPEDVRPDGADYQRGRVFMTGDANAATLQMDKEQHIVSDQSSPGEHLHREEIGASQHIHVSGDEIPPGSGLASLGSRS